MSSKPSDNKQFAIVGLGNPGKRYENTRHNVGAEAVTRFGEKLGAGSPGGQGWRTRNESYYFKADFEGAVLYLILPQTFMNLSGEGVQPLLAYFKVPPANLIVVYDELDLAPGYVRVKRGGGAGGHNGLSSIIERLGDPEFHRVRIGIGRPEIPAGADKGEIVSSWVLSRARPDERVLLDRGVDTACQALECFLKEGPAAAQNQFNRKSVTLSGAESEK